MRCTVRTTDGQYFTLTNMPTETAVHLAAELTDMGGSPVLTFDMDGATIIVQRQHIVALELQDE